MLIQRICNAASTVANSARWILNYVVYAVIAPMIFLILLPNIPAEFCMCYDRSPDPFVH
jgi:hypothetical protein